MKELNGKTQKERELEAFRQRRQAGRRQKRKRKMRIVFRVVSRISLFLCLVVLAGVIGYKGLSNVLSSHQTKVEVASQKIFDVEELQLVLNEEGTFLKFYIQQQGEDNEEKIVATQQKIDNLRFRSRKDHPTPYLRVVCENDSEVCQLEEAKEVIFFINKEDITGLQVN